MHLDATIDANRFADVPRESASAERPRDSRDRPDCTSLPDAADFVALSQFTVAHMSDEVKQSFRRRPHRVDSAVGFVRMDVLSPAESPDEIWLLTYWKDEPSYQTWHHSHHYQESHQGIPKGLKLVPRSVSLRFFQHIAS